MIKGTTVTQHSFSKLADDRPLAGLVDELSEKDINSQSFLAGTERRLALANNKLSRHLDELSNLVEIFYGNSSCSAKESQQGPAPGSLSDKITAEVSQVQEAAAKLESIVADIRCIIG